jgi:uroporphyrinogen decarboxylase
MNRREFLAGSAVSAAAFADTKTAINKRDRMLRWLEGKVTPNYTPAAFFLHFGDAFKAGPAAAQKHLEFFRATDMDFVKVQFEQTYQRQDFLQKPADWSKLTLRKLDFYEPLLVTVRELVKSAKKDALILMTLYSPFMCAGHCATSPLLLKHLEENPEAVKKGLEILTESQMLFVKACIKEGIDGFYMSTQGSEAKRFSSPKIFKDYVKPYDLVSMKEIQKACAFNILHVCDYVAPYANYDAVYDYPGHVINCNSKLTDKSLVAAEIVRTFKRPYMGGLDRHGVIVKGTPEQVEAEIKRVVKAAPKQFILGADCTVAGDTDWTRLHHAISVAHRVSAS